jgi:DNA-directed RNA polymerase specialized sigma24 family protein
MGDEPTQEEVRNAYMAAMAVAMKILKSKSRAEEVVQDVFEALLTTRPWVRAKGPFDRHVVGATCSIISNQRQSAAPKRDKQTQSGFQREVIGHSALSPEQKTLDRAEEEGAQTDAEAELDALEASVADNPVAVAVLRCRRAHEEPPKAAEIAREIGHPVELVYRANDVLKDHLRKLRSRGKKD